MITILVNNQNVKNRRKPVKANKIVAAALCLMMLCPICYAGDTAGLSEDRVQVEEAISAESTEMGMGEETVEDVQYGASLEMTAEEAEKEIAAVESDIKKHNTRPVYRLGVGDRITIIVRHHPEFSGEVMVEPDGMITIPLTGDTAPAEGLTKRELAQAITEVISYYVESPRVAVTISSFESKFYYVVGMVGRPGKYPLGNRDIHVKDAIIQAGLTIRGASTKKIHVITPSKTGNPTFEVANLNEILYKGNLTTDVVIQPGQIIVVPSNFFTKWNSTLQELLAPITSIAAASYIYRTFRELPPFEHAKAL